MTDSVETFGISLDAAEAYERKFVPALFAEWAPLVVDCAGITAGQHILDVACGTGVVARAAADRVGSEGAVIGVDLNEAMLEVARRIRPDLEWRHGDASALPFPDDSFDAVVCQSACMFFPDRTQALREMARVVRPGGTVAVQVWGSRDDQPAYGPFMRIAAQHAGPDAADLLNTYWVLGDLELMESVFEAAGLQPPKTTTHVGTARFGSIEEVVRVEVEATPLAERIDDATYARIIDDTRAALARFETPEGRAELPIVGHILAATA